MTILTTKYLITSRRDNALTAYESAAAAAAAVEDHPSTHVREVIFRMLADAADEVLSVAATTLGDVRRKLEVYWGDDLFEDGYGNDWKRIILGDLMRLHMLEGGVDWDEASGGTDRVKLASDWAAAASDYDRHLENNREATPAKDGENASSDSFSSMEEVEGRMLSLAAPDVAAVLAKLAALWRDDRLDPVWTSTGHARIFRDLRRLAGHQQ
jgi:hypothetical protein